MTIANQLAPQHTKAEVKFASEGYIYALESCGTVDGPGVRFIVFTTGCPLRCQYCHNVDSFQLENGELRKTEDIIEEISGYTNFLKAAKGGITISGGEPLMQPEFTHAILRGAKKMGLHTALDTTGFLGKKASDELLADVDLVLLDIKSFTPDLYKKVTGANIKPTLDFARRLDAMSKPVWLRFVLVPGLTDDVENMEQLADFLATLSNLERFEILPFHKMGEHKWKNVPLKYQLANTKPTSAEQMDFAKSIFAKRNILSS